MNKIPSLEEMLKLYTKKDLWERIQHHIKRIDDLQSQLDQQKAMWNELKESIQKERKYNATIYERDDIAIEHIEASKVLLKMKELEQGEKDGRNNTI